MILSVHCQQATTTFSFSSLRQREILAPVATIAKLPLDNCQQALLHCTTVGLLCYDSVQNLGKATLRATCLVYLLFTANVTCDCKLQTRPLYQYHLTLINLVVNLIPAKRDPTAQIITNCTSLTVKLHFLLICVLLVNEA